MKFNISPLHLVLLLIPPPFGRGFTPNIIVISPPGGVGEVATVSCAKKGASVKWCVVSPPSPSPTTISLSEESLRSISAAGGAVDIVGSPASSLLEDSDGGSAGASAREAIKVWSGSDEWEGIICTLDGSEGEGEVEDAVKVAVREVCGGKSGGVKVVVMPEEAGGEEETKKGGGDGIWGLLKKKDVPASITEAVGTGTVVSLRHAELFGIPESSKDASPFINGPRRAPILRDEYTQRSIRLSPTALPRTRTSRLSLGDAAALLALRTLTPPATTVPASIYLTSLVGSEEPTEEEWTSEYSKCNEQLTGSQLLRVDLVVEDVGRLSDWLATKWAPTILRTYDIAGIRVGERPVFAARGDDDDTVEIVWQQLVDFDSVTVGKMLIDVTKDGIVARRAPGDSTKGYGSVKLGALQGENILVKSLGDAAAQAIEKGLARKPKRAKPKKAKTETPLVTPTTSVVTSGATIPQEQPAPAAVEKPSLESGPRSAGARRSSRRTRGKRRKEGEEEEESAVAGGAATTSAEESAPESWQ